ncbi:MAG: metallophosphoesterase family protein [Desulfobacterales bacterium]|nr:metallophosphoesterase family protein [Desulfobacterales bacterium]
MKLCVFSDIHGNGIAFHEAYKKIISEKVDINIFLGDLCGYYFDQKEIFLMLQTIPDLIALKGNHDEMFCRIYKGDEALRQEYLIKYGPSMELLIKQDVNEMVKWLDTLKYSHTIHELGLYICHGSPWSELWEYIYPDSSLDKFLNHQKSSFILGHTHYSMIKTVGDKLIMNPGSIGQPRGDRWPTYALIEFPSRKVVFRDIHYCKEKLIKQIDQLNCENKYLKEVLCR